MTLLSVMPECLRLTHRFAAETRSPGASPAQCAGYDGAYRAFKAMDSRHLHAGMTCSDHRQAGMPQRAVQSKINNPLRLHQLQRRIAEQQKRPQHILRSGVLRRHFTLRLHEHIAQPRRAIFQQGLHQRVAQENSDRCPASNSSARGAPPHRRQISTTTSPPATALWDA